MRRVTAAAPFFLLVMSFAACGGDDATAARTSTTPTSEVSTTTAKSRTTLGDVVELTGVVVGVHPTEPIAYVSIVTTSTEGCEGGDFTHLYAQRLTGGQPVQVLPERMSSGSVLNSGDDGRVAIVDQCEGYLGSLSTALARDDGTFEDVQKVDTTATEADGRRQIEPGTVRWGADGRSFVAIVRDLEGNGTRIVRIRLDGAFEDLGSGADLVAVEELANGELARATATTLTIGAGAPIATKVTSLALRPDRRAVDVVGSDGIREYELGARDGVGHAIGPASVASWSSDGSALAYLQLHGEGTPSARLAFVDLEVSAHAGFGAPLLTADGKWVLYNEAVDDGQGYATPHARARAINNT
jgi:hypothetical protein